MCIRDRDWRKLIENKDIDVVIVGTPDHWHCLQMVAACEAGKDVYCEKPLGRTIEECNIMVEAAKKHKTIVQVVNGRGAIRTGKVQSISYVQVNWAKSGLCVYS